MSTLCPKKFIEKKKAYVYDMMLRGTRDAGQGGKWNTVPSRLLR
jgi:hypothetical protein